MFVPFRVSGDGLMMVQLDRRFLAQMPARQVNWRGRSGRFYALIAERLDSFSLDDDLSRMTVVWDLEGAEPVTGLSAA
jgi:hypothetical protein